MPDQAVGDLTPQNLFTTVDVAFHRRHRRLLSSGLSETSLQAFHPIVEQRVNLAIARMGEEMQTRGAADVFKWFLFMATDVIGELTFGESFRMLELGEVSLFPPLGLWYQRLPLFAWIWVLIIKKF